MRVLGTLLFEHDEASADAGRLLERGSEGEFLFATQLVRMAEVYGFDGWLLNVEASLPRSKWSVRSMQEFLRELQAGLAVSGAMAVWYDAVTVMNRIHYQNGLTLLNAPWLYAADKLFSNYGWRAKELLGTKRVAQVMGRTADVLMGVDCYGRGSLGDGGFGVGEALEEVRKAGLHAAALFAPGWTWENFQGLGFRGVERKFWGVVEESVVAHPAGSKDGFYTCFNRGFGDKLFMKGKVLFPSAPLFLRRLTSAAHLGNQMDSPGRSVPPAALLPHAGNIPQSGQHQSLDRRLVPKTQYEPHHHPHHNTNLRPALPPLRFPTRRPLSVLQISNDRHHAKRGYILGHTAPYHRRNITAHDNVRDKLSLSAAHMGQRYGSCRR